MLRDLPEFSTIDDNNNDITIMLKQSVDEVERVKRKCT